MSMPQVLARKTLRDRYGLDTECATYPQGVGMRQEIGDGLGRKTQIDMFLSFAQIKALYAFATKTEGLAKDAS